MAKPDGGPAFPLGVTSVQGEGLAFSDNDKACNGGMTLRDYAQIAFIQGMFASGPFSVMSDADIFLRVKQGQRAADIMIAERDK